MQKSMSLKYEPCRLVFLCAGDKALYEAVVPCLEVLHFPHTHSLSLSHTHTISLSLPSPISKFVNLENKALYEAVVPSRSSNLRNCSPETPRKLKLQTPNTVETLFQIPKTVDESAVVPCLEFLHFPRFFSSSSFLLSSLELSDTKSLCALNTRLSCPASRSFIPPNSRPETPQIILRILVYLVIYDSGYESFEHLLLSWYPRPETVPSHQQICQLSAGTPQINLNRCNRLWGRSTCSWGRWARAPT